MWPDLSLPIQTKTFFAIGLRVFLPIVVKRISSKGQYIGVDIL